LSATWIVGRHEVDPDRYEIRCEGSPTSSVEPRTMRVLMHLVERADEVVSVRELLDVVWKDVVVTQDSVYTSIASLRRLLGDDGDAHRVIINVPRRGYRLVAPVRRMDAPQARFPREDAPSKVAAPEPSAPATRRQPAWGVRHWLMGGLIIAALLAAYPALQHLRGVAPAAMRAGSSLAVMPFTDLSDKQDQQYFADGLAEEVLDELAHIPGLKVIGRTSSFRFRGKSEDTARIGKMLGAAYLLEGSVRRVADQIRVSAQLVAAQDGTQRWSKTYEVPTVDAFRLQDSVAADLARYLKLTVADVEPDRNRMRPEVYDLYLRGRQLVDSLSEENVVRAVAILEEAARLDPDSARIQSVLAIGYAAMAFEGWAPPAEACAASKRHAQAALQLEPDNAIAHAALGAIIAEYEWDWPRARTEIDAAVRLAPTDPWVLFLAATVESVDGSWDRAKQRSEELLAVDPLSHLAELALGGRILLRHGDFLGAEKHLRRAIQIRPEFQSLRYFLAMALLMQGRADEALAEGAQIAPEEGRDVIAAMAFHSLHRPGESDAALERATALLGDPWPFGIAAINAYRGQADEAMRWLDRTYRSHGLDVWLIKGDPAFRGMERDPRYLAFLRKMNLPT
jgi:TolB-like protein/DNA-binding winged helix-turn-helix (wHTH) protein/Flp pilus assembly protein TadD